MKKIRVLDILSLAGSFMVAFGLLVYVQILLFGWIPYLKNTAFMGFVNLRDLVFSAVALVLINRFISFYIPRRGGT